MLQTLQATTHRSAVSTLKFGGRAFSILLANIHAHIVPIAVVSLYTLALFIYIEIFHLESLAHFALYNGTAAFLFALTLGFFFIIYCFKAEIHDMPEKLFPHVMRKLKDEFFTLDRLFGATLAIALFILMLITFANFKRMIPAVIPFHLDTNLSELDRWLHLGTDPWQWLQPFIGFPIMTFAINIMYNLWLFLIIVVFYWQAFSVTNKELRKQYLLAFFLCWILIGTLAATFLSSAGPCYYHRFGDVPNVYAPLMTYLHHADAIYPIWALDMQDILLKSYDLKSTTMASGITAMPSMHVSIAWLMVLLGWRINPFAGWVFSLYCGVILIGSVHLGWHYAVDGYVSIMLTTLIWHLSGKVLTRKSLSW